MEELIKKLFSDWSLSGS